MNVVVATSMPGISHPPSEMNLVRPWYVEGPKEPFRSAAGRLQRNGSISLAPEVAQYARARAREALSIPAKACLYPKIDPRKNSGAPNRSGADFEERGDLCDRAEVFVSHTADLFSL